MEKEKLHGQFLRETEGCKIKRVMKAGELKREPRALYMLPKSKHSANAVKNESDHQGVSPLCRLYKGKIESVTHVVSLCSVLAGNQFRKRHD